MKKPIIAGLMSFIVTVIVGVGVVSAQTTSPSPSPSPSPTPTAAPVTPEGAPNTGHGTVVYYE